jgi:hypothetical protein
MAASGARSHEHSRGADQRGGADSDEHLAPVIGNKIMQGTLRDDQIRDYDKR